MALPAGVSACTVTISAPIGVDGSVGSLASVSVTADRALVWTATGERLYQDTVIIPVDGTYGSASFEVPHVDQVGFKDAAGNAVSNWVYTLQFVPRIGSQAGSVITKRFQVMVGQDEIDADQIPDQGAISNPPVTAPVQPVTSVVGEVGEVTAEQIVEGIGPELSGAIEAALQGLDTGGGSPTVESFRAFVQTGGITEDAPFVPILDSKTGNRVDPSNDTAAHFRWDRLRTIRNQPYEGFEGVPAEAIQERGFNGSSTLVYLSSDHPEEALALNPSAVAANALTNDARDGALGTTVEDIGINGAELLVALYDRFMTADNAPLFWIWWIPTPVVDEDTVLVTIDPQVMTSGIRRAYALARLVRPNSLLYDSQTRLFTTTSPTELGPLNADPIHQSVQSYEIEGDDFAAWVDAGTPWSLALATAARTDAPASPWTIYHREVEDLTRYVPIGDYVFVGAGPTYADITPVTGLPLPKTIAPHDLIEFVSGDFTYLLPTSANPNVSGANVRITGLALPTITAAPQTAVRVWRRLGSSYTATDAAMKDTSYGRKYLGRVHDLTDSTHLRIESAPFGPSRYVPSAGTWTPVDGDKIYVAGRTIDIASNWTIIASVVFSVNSGLGGFDFTPYIGAEVAIVGAQI